MSPANEGDDRLDELAGTDRELLHAFVCALGAVGCVMLVDEEDGSLAEVAEDGLMHITIAEGDWSPIEHALMVASRYLAEAEEGAPGATYTTAMDLPGRDAHDAACGFVKQYGDRIDEAYARRVTRPWSGADRIARERRRQIQVEGWTPEHDREHADGSLALAAVAYASPLPVFVDPEGFHPRDPWPWSPEWDKRPVDLAEQDEGATVRYISDPRTRDRDTRIRELEKAGALIAAELDRLTAEQAPAERGAS